MPLPFIAGFFILWSLLIGGITTAFVKHDTAIRVNQKKESGSLSQEETQGTYLPPLYQAKEVRGKLLAAIAKKESVETVTTPAEGTPQAEQVSPVIPVIQNTKQTVPVKPKTPTSLFKKIFAIDTNVDPVVPDPVIPDPVVTPPAIESALSYSLTDIASHSTSGNCWIIVNNKVYSVSGYISMHPGGQSTIINQCGKDATTVFTNRGGTGSHSTSAWSLLNTFLIGNLAIKSNGVCGAANTVTFSTTPSSGLCNTGTPSSISGSGPWTWSCSGVSGGLPVNCGAQKGLATPLNGTCGSAHGTSITTTPSTGLCSTGTATSVNGSGPWSWNCSGLNGGLTSSCSASVPQTNGSCGTAGGASFSSAPSSGLCSSGNNSTVNGSGPWSWSCSGLNGGSAVSCNAQLQQTSSSYTAADVAAHAAPSNCWIIINNNVYSVASYLAMHPGGQSVITAQCGKDASTVFANRGGTGSHSTSAWSLLNTFLIGTLSSAVTPVTPVTPTAVNGTCGTSNGTTLSSAPTSGFCSLGTATSVTGSGPWSWSCSGSSGGSTASCSASKTAAVSSAYTPATVATHNTSTNCWIIVNNNVYSVASYLSLHPGGQSVITAQCGKDATTVFTNRGGTGSHSASAWSLLNTFLIGTLSSAVTPVTPVTPTAVNGTCGTSNGTTLSSAPTSGFCSVGTATSVTGSGPWSWSCAGSSGGSTASCSASKAAVVSSAYTLADVATHNTSTNCWFIVNSNVYSVASYLSLHPGGRTVILNQCGKDATSAFTTRGNTGGHSASAWSLLNQYLIGTYTTATTPTAVNGTCGTSNGTTLSSAPTSGFCSVGTATSVTGSGPWSWSCAGSSGGSTASCSASLPGTQTTPTTPPVTTTTPTTYTVHVTSQGNYDVTSLSLNKGDSITFVYSAPISGEVDTRFTPTGISSVKIDKDITQKTRLFPTAGTWTFKAVDKSGNTGTVTVK